LPELWQEPTREESHPDDAAKNQRERTYHVSNFGHQRRYPQWLCQ
jgi:hypothetical protein